MSQNLVLIFVTFWANKTPCVIFSSKNGIFSVRVFIERWLKDSRTPKSTRWLVACWNNRIFSTVFIYFITSIMIFYTIDTGKYTWSSICVNIFFDTWNDPIFLSWANIKFINQIIFSKVFFPVVSSRVFPIVI